MTSLYYAASQLYVSSKASVGTSLLMCSSGWWRQCFSRDSTIVTAFCLDYRRSFRSVECSRFRTLPASFVACISEVLICWHWLRISKSIPFKMAVLAQWSLHGSSPSYLVKSLSTVSVIFCRRRRINFIFVPMKSTACNWEGAITAVDCSFPVACGCCFLQRFAIWRRHFSLL